MTFGIRHYYGRGRVKSEREQARSDMWLYGPHLLLQAVLIATLVYGNFKCWSEARGLEMLAAGALTTVSLLLVGMFGLYLIGFIDAVRTFRRRA